MESERAEIAIVGFSRHYMEKLGPDLSEMNTRKANTAIPAADVTHPKELLQGVRPNNDVAKTC
jgi:hypothetical protein